MRLSMSLGLLFPSRRHMIRLPHRRVVRRTGRQDTHGARSDAVFVPLVFICLKNILVSAHSPYFKGIVS